MRGSAMFTMVPSRITISWAKEMKTSAFQRRGSLLLRREPQSLAVGLAASLVAVAVTTALIYPLRQITPAESNGVVYMLAVLLVSTFWGLGPGLVTASASALAFNFFHIPPTGRFTIREGELANLARTRADEAERRREEADLAADLARLLLGGADIQDALGSAAHRLAAALDLPSASIVLRRLEGDRRRLALRWASVDRGCAI